jgi:sialic acid synthase SpsE
MHDVHLCVGKPNGLSLNDAEIEYRNKMKKFAILKNNVSKGDKLSSVEVYFKRVNLEGISRRNFLEFKDSRFNKDLEAGSPIKKEYLDA